MNRKAVIELHFLPCVDYFSLFASRDEIFIEACEHYSKQTYRNRCLIFNGHKTMALSVPVRKADGKIPIKNVKIEDKHRALILHTRTIRSVYGKAPWFEIIGPEIIDTLLRNKRNLFEMNVEILSLCLKFLKIKTRVSFTSAYFPGRVYEENGIEDFRDKIHPKKPHVFKNLPYKQIFGKEFAGNLSIIDLLFSEGPLAADFLTGERVKPAH